MRVDTSDGFGVKSTLLKRLGCIRDELSIGVLAVGELQFLDVG